MSCEGTGPKCGVHAPSDPRTGAEGGRLARGPPRPAPGAFREANPRPDAPARLEAVQRAEAVRPQHLASARLAVAARPRGPPFLDVTGVTAPVVEQDIHLVP